jgi:hypothetical protein
MEEERTMKSPLKSLSLAFTVISIILFLVAIGSAREAFIPPVPDKSKTLPANDGGPDGCDSSRFKCVMDGEAILDNQTGLVWARNTAILEKPLPWEEAMKFVEAVDIGGKSGWRLPTKDELITLLDTSQSYPALPEAHPFLKMNNIPQGGPKSNRQYWTSTECEGDNQCAWMIGLKVGRVFDSPKWLDYKIWPVRDGE